MFNPRTYNVIYRVKRRIFVNLLAQIDVELKHVSSDLVEDLKKDARQLRKDFISKHGSLTLPDCHKPAASAAVGGVKEDEKEKKRRERKERKRKESGRRHKGKGRESARNSILGSLTADKAPEEGDAEPLTAEEAKEEKNVIQQLVENDEERAEAAAEATTVEEPVEHKEEEETSVPEAQRAYLSAFNKLRDRLHEEFKYLEGYNEQIARFVRVADRERKLLIDMKIINNDFLQPKKYRVDYANEKLAELKALQLSLMDKINKMKVKYCPYISEVEPSKEKEKAKVERKESRKEKKVDKHEGKEKKHK